MPLAKPFARPFAIHLVKDEPMAPSGNSQVPIIR